MLRYTVFQEEGNTTIFTMKVWLYLQIREVLEYIFQVRYSFFLIVYQIKDEDTSVTWNACRNNLLNIFPVS